MFTIARGIHLQVLLMNNAVQAVTARQVVDQQRVLNVLRDERRDRSVDDFEVKDFNLSPKLEADRGTRSRSSASDAEAKTHTCRR